MRSAIAARHRRPTQRMALLAASAALALSLCCGAAQAGALRTVKSSGKIIYCSDLSQPPFLYFDPQTLKPTGFDIAIGSAIAKTMGVQAEYKNIGFDGLIPALQAGQCDAIISALYDKPARRKVVDFVDYDNVGNAVIVLAGSALFVQSLTGLSGKKVSVERGSVNEQEVLAANDALKSAGKPLITVVSLPKATDAIQQLQAGLADAFYGGTATAASYEKAHAGQLKLGSPVLSAFKSGIATLKSDADLHDAMQAAFDTIMKDGTYKTIVDTWSFQSMTLQP